MSIEDYVLQEYARVSKYLERRRALRELNQILLASRSDDFVSELVKTFGLSDDLISTMTFDDLEDALKVRVSDLVRIILDGEKS